MFTFCGVSIIMYYIYTVLTVKHFTTQCMLLHFSGFKDAYQNTVGILGLYLGWQTRTVYQLMNLGKKCRALDSSKSYLMYSPIQLEN